MTKLSKMLEEYRAGERGMPTYDELAALLDKPLSVRVFQSAEQNEQLARDAQAILAAAPQVVADERAAFEAWWTENMNLEAMDLHHFGDDQYACHDTNRSWLTWQARAAIAAIATAPVQAQEPVGCANPEAVFAMLCEQRGYPSDGEWDGPMRAAFNCGMDFCKSTASRLEPTSDRAPVQPAAVPDGWPTAEMVVRGAEQLHDCLRICEAHDFDANLQGTEIQQEIAESVFKSMIELAAPTAQGDAKQLTKEDMHEAYYAYSGNSEIDYDGREWSNFMGGWNAAIAAKAAS